MLLAERYVMYCASCASHIQSEFTAEINIHFGDPRRNDNPGLLVFPKLLVCLECGSSRFTTPENELALLAKCSLKIGAFARKGGAPNVALCCTTADGA
jgi:hypothetical protein